MRCRELCCLDSPSWPVHLCCIFTSPPLTNIIKRTRLPPGLCLYHCKLLKMLEELQYVVKFSPSCRSKNSGKCFICCPFISVSEKQWEVTEKVWLDVYCFSYNGLFHSSCVFSPSFHVSFPNSLYLPHFSFYVFLKILLSVRKSHSYSCLQIRVLCAEFSGSNQTHMIFVSIRSTLVRTVASPFSSSSERVAESACS